MVSHFTDSWGSIIVGNNYVTFYYKSYSGQNLILNTLESNANPLDVSTRHVHSAQMNGGLQ